MAIREEKRRGYTRIEEVMRESKGAIRTSESDTVEDQEDWKDNTCRHDAPGSNDVSAGNLHRTARVSRINEMLIKEANMGIE